MSDRQLVTTEQVDFLTEMMNIGAGNAAAALEQMIKCEVDILVPQVFVVPTEQAPSVLGNPSMPIICVKMGMVGDVVGDLYFIVPKEYMKKLVRLAEEGTLHPKRLRATAREGGAPNNVVLSTISEIANVIAGVYFTAIHDFCGLNIYHTVPAIAVDMVQALLDEAFARLSVRIETVVVIENEFTVERERVRTFLMIVPSTESAKALVNSIGRAEMAYHSK